MKNFILTSRKCLQILLSVFVLVYSAATTADMESIASVSFETADGVIDNDLFTDKIVLVDFWASWCKPCLKSFPWMNEMHTKYADKGLHIVAVNLDKDPALSEKFLEKTPAKFTLARDQSATLAKEFGVTVMPSSFYFGRDGSFIEKHLGFREDKTGEYETRIRELLGVE